MPTIMYPAQFMDDEEGYQQELGQQKLKAIDTVGSTYYGFDEEEDYQQYTGQEKYQTWFPAQDLSVYAAPQVRGTGTMPPMLIYGGIAIVGLALFMFTRRG